METLTASNFELAFRSKYQGCLSNNFSDNHDSWRFGKSRKSLAQRFRSTLFRNYTSNSFIRKANRQLDSFLEKYGEDATRTFELLQNLQSRILYLDLLCFRLLGPEKVKITDTLNLLEEREHMVFRKGNSFKTKIRFNTNNWVLEDYIVDIDHTQLKIISRPSAIYNEFIIQQYAYLKDDVAIDISNGDVCIDAGACWGDSTMLFSSKSGQNGKVYAIEFIPGNIDILEKNLSLNRELSHNVEIVRRPLWNISKIPVWYNNKGPASRVSMKEFEGAEGNVETLTIDQLVKDHDLSALDFIKMDIEGAESVALEGARDSIARFKPKLAICIYHSLSDFTKIAGWIDDLNLGYKFYLKHATIHAEETVLFAI